MLTFDEYVGFFESIVWVSLWLVTEVPLGYEALLSSAFVVCESMSPSAAPGLF